MELPYELQAPRSLLDHAKEGILCYDAQGKVIYANHEAHQLTGADDLLGRFGAEFIHPEDLEEAHAAFLALAQSPGQHIEVEQRLVTAAGSTRWIAARLLQIGDTSTDYQIASFFLDITAQKELEEYLLRTQRLDGVGLTVAQLSHDLANLLQTILGNIELIRLESDQDDLDPRLERAFKSASDVNALAQRVLGHASSGPLRRRGVFANEFFAERIDLLRHLIPRKVHFALKAPVPAPVLMDATRLEQIVCNLVSNAGRAASPGGHVDLRIETERWTAATRPDRPGPVDGSYVKITVVDDGRGMDDEVKSRIFDMFYSADGRGGGTGLGLAIVQQLVTQANGFIEVTSEPGAGAEFAVFLPQHLGPIDNEVPPGPLPYGKGVILLLIPDIAVSDFVEATLAGLDYDVEIAATPESASHLLERPRVAPDLIIWDLELEMNAAQWEQIAGSLPDLKVLGITSFSAGEDKTRLCNAILDKPFGITHLANAVSKLTAPPAADHPSQGSEGP